MAIPTDPASSPWTLYPGQVPPLGPWRTWLCIGGMGAGKTHGLSVAILTEAMKDPEARILVVGPSLVDVLQRQIGVDPDDSRSSSILKLVPPGFAPEVRVKQRVLKFPNGSRVHWASATKPEALRGFSATLVCGRLLEEWCSFPALDECRMAARHVTTRMRAEGLAARLILSARANPTALLRNVVEHSRDLVRTRLSSFDNAHNLCPVYMEYARRLRHTTQGLRDHEGHLYFSPEEYETLRASGND